MKKKIGFLSLLLAAASYGSFGIWIRLLSHEMSIYQQIVFRNVIAFMFAILIIIIGKRYGADLKDVSKKNLILYALVVPIAVILYNIGMLNLKIAVATFAFYIGSIIFSELIGIIVFRDKITPLKLISLTLVVIGLGCFIYPFTSTTMSVGFWACLASGLFDGIGNGFRRNLAGKLDKFFLVAVTAIGGMVVSGAMMINGHQTLTFINHLSVTTWIIGIVFGLILMLVNYLLLIGFQNFELGPGVITLSTELFFALIFGLIVFREIPLAKELIGGLFILTASILPNLNWGNKKT